MLGQSRFVRRFRLWAVPRMAPAMLASALAGCASFSSDAGMGGVNRVVAPQLGTAALKVGSGETTAKAATQTRALLRTPLSAEAAVRVALLNNKGLQATYNGLGIAEAVMVEASLPTEPNNFTQPHCDTGRTRHREPDRRRHSRAGDPAGAY